jgi:hydrogenase nickel incorporation protein HypB
MKRVKLEKKVLSENDTIAARLRERFHEHHILCLNLISSPGSGKTTLLERTLEGFDPGERVGVLTGDIQTDADAARLRRYKFPVKQITTGGTCHLDARMIESALADFPVDDLHVLFIENVGNLVCPASYDLGEAAKIVLLSVAEGDEKPLKYPGIFFKSALMVVTKLDLLPHVPFDLAKAQKNARRINPEIEIRRVSCTTGEGLLEWREWIEKRRELVRQKGLASVI